MTIIYEYRIIDRFSDFALVCVCVCWGGGGGGGEIFLGEKTFWGVKNIFLERCTPLKQDG
jgi:hypothetical protein